MDDFYRGKHILLTGSTGFLGKVLLESLLRKLDVAAVYLLVRPKKGLTPLQRVEEELFASPIWDRLREERGAETVTALFRERVIPVGGDLCVDGLALSASDAAMLRDKVQIVLHSAASVNFNDPLKEAINMNTLGSLRVLALAHECPRLVSYVHVSTAYVNSNRRTGSRVKEKLYPLDFDPEAVAEASRTWTRADSDRAQLDLTGTYPNTYTVTKSMSEHLVRRRRGAMPLVIFRPTIIACSWAEPVPGWTDVVSAAGAVFLAGGVGLLSVIPGNPRNIADIVPVDFVVNHLLVATFLNAGRDRLVITHSGTSCSETPLTWRVAVNNVPVWYNKIPPTRRLGPCRFQMLQSHQHFQIQWFFRYTLPSSVFSTYANAFGSPAQRKNAERLWKMVWRARLVVESFKHFTSNTWFFTDRNRAAMARELAPEDLANFPLDVSVIDWVRYLDCYQYGMARWVMGESFIPVSRDAVAHTEMALSTDRLLEWDPDHHRISFPGLFSDISWAYTSSRKPGYTKSGVLGRVMGYTGWKEGMNHEAAYVPRAPTPRPASVRVTVLADRRVVEAMRAEAEATGKPQAEVLARANGILDVMESHLEEPVRDPRVLAWALRKVMRQVYEGIRIDEAGLERVRDTIAAGTGPVVLLPTHRSYMDFIVLSYVFFAYNLPLPYIAAGEDFLNIGFVTTLLRRSGAFFMRRGGLSEDPLYGEVLRAYMQALLVSNQCVEFFVEGTRSRSGKQLAPKLGLLDVAIEPYLDGRISDLHIVPVSIDFERPLETALYSTEVLGKSKARESLQNLLKASSILRSNFGFISLRFGEPMALSEAVPQAVASIRKTAAAEASAEEAAAAAAAHADAVTRDAGGAGAATSSSSASSPPPPPPPPPPAVSTTYPTSRASSFFTSAPPAATFDPVGVPEHRRALCRRLAYRVVGEMQRVGCIMPTHITATLVLMYRQGIGFDNLVDKLQWLLAEVRARGHAVECVEGFPPKLVVERALGLLGDLVTTRPGRDLQEPNAEDRADYWRLVALGYYRNKLLRIFAREGLWACALYAEAHAAREAQAGPEGAAGDAAAMAAAAAASTAAATATATAAPGAGAGATGAGAGAAGGAAAAASADGKASAWQSPLDAYTRSSSSPSSAAPGTRRADARTGGRGRASSAAMGGAGAAAMGGAEPAEDSLVGECVPLPSVRPGVAFLDSLLSLEFVRETPYGREADLTDALRSALATGTFALVHEAHGVVSPSPDGAAGTGTSTGTGTGTGTGAGAGGGRSGGAGGAGVRAPATAPAAGARGDVGDGEPAHVVSAVVARASGRHVDVSGGDPDGAADASAIKRVLEGMGARGGAGAGAGDGDDDASEEGLHVTVPAESEELYSLLCGLVWPFIDSYWVAVVSLYALPRPKRGRKGRAAATPSLGAEEREAEAGVDAAEPDASLFVPTKQLLNRMQWLAETLFHNRMICFYESCSLETLGNALNLLVSWRVLTRGPPAATGAAARGGGAGGGKKANAPPEPCVALLAPYTGRAALSQLAATIERFRKPAPVRAPVDSLSSSLTADLPMLARL